MTTASRNVFFASPICGVTRPTRTALHLASQRGWTSLVEALLDDNVSVLNTAGDTPASVALLAYEYDLALRFFCDFGADGNTVMVFFLGQRL
ncbi:hypothetical protein SDRG_12985 [Saprolegnia diclina VS20]|uniref:Uncharacterized protein n=1 Tax=Saprolegnia diclina (strain VS20) TaxID=1156394 RepID=T0Q3Z6_SAPDV|nr:hypothetical protein SDRG_12985 [Saprolegnia diclina VS20]EQC29316.1 hypothetical protein SDRG_12985 [Saprolegnia diclina VS20]|eukprot:XP_008617290.1 hypothetical protein SDRG_12985 [Saprolegnia diclina VS20]